MWNVTSMINKTSAIMEHLLDRDPSIVFLSETWLKSNRNHVTALVKTYGYVLLHNRRKNRDKELGGGVGILLKTGMSFKHLNYKQYSSFEITILKISLKDNKSLILVSIYRVLFVSVTTFLEEIVHLFEILSSLKEDIILAGDINIHVEENELYSNQFKDILNSFNIVQHVDFPTHIQEHTLDIIATFGNSPLITGLEANLYDISHHFLVDFNVEINLEKKLYKTISYRNTKCINWDHLQEEVHNKLNISEESSFEVNVTKYNETLSSSVSEHAPLKTQTLKLVRDAPWFDTEYENLRKLRRKAEKQYRKSGLEVHKEDYRNLRKQCTDKAHKKKCRYYADRLESTNGKVLYSVVNQLLDNKQDKVLPDSKDDAQLANDFMSYFIDKIRKIRLKFDNGGQPLSATCPTVPNVKLSSFEPTNCGEILQIVKSFGIKCSPDDPMPSDILKKITNTFVPIWTELVNLSLSEGSMDCLKSAILLPLIKDLENYMVKDNFKNYRPVSNLQYIGKLIERVISIRLNKHLEDNNLHSNIQYGYRKGHSTETLLLKIVNDLLINCDEQKPSILMLLDLSAAFDTVDQSKLLLILQEEIGVEGIALKWFESFLQGRTQKVKIGNEYSVISELMYGVPQGSVLGPDLFKIYIRSLKRYIEPAKFKIFGFADDHQLMKSFLPFLQVKALGSDLQNCFDLIEKWMNEYFLCLNASKTKILIVTPPFLKDKIIIQGTFINERCVRFVNSAKNLGVTIDNDLSFKYQVTNVVKSCFIVIRKLSKIKSYLSYEQLRTVVYACVFSKLDYCNSLYFGIESKLINRLQSVQNSAVRLLCKKKNTNVSVDNFIRDCHWLKVRERIIFKFCLIIHNCLHGVAPMSLKELLTYSSSTRTQKLIQHPFKRSFGDRSFKNVAPKLWNLLPLKIRMESRIDVFKKSLKTYLFDNSNSLMQKFNEC